ncbi:TPA: acyltransferase [Pasteurella multocida]|uniref:LatB n=3 Tax=Pasteurella multocida TaxID=747 RepID=A0A097IYS0_PASMD|nr:acyltransferase family protein [Pasteurella multocida]AIT72038.1 LatB [Pasteurella multocida subsp. multocida]MCL7798502.1 acyltransferase [Pasteurella multocida]MDG2541342.1 acyltransferase family protein [Pasteurella multocida]HDR0697090.1 acyltransferase [Pasteurella multocida]HDR0701204.1 acyltransferase [Pasteurella multocida]
MQYRADIDGLRALAILSVVIFHINYSLLPGGFLGVDIFFVISGYLITSIIYVDINSGKFSFSEFYQKRIRRILPAFFFVMIFATLFGLYIYHNKATKVELLKSSVEAIKFIINFYFAKSGGYFDLDVIEKPLLHFWSLAVEEQFYFIFPLFLILIVKNPILFRNKYSILLILAILSICSTFIVSNYNIYYLFHARAIELLVGSFIAIYSIEYKNDLFLYNKFLSLLSPLSFFILVACIVFFDKDTPFFPGVSSLLPCTATALLIYGNTYNKFFTKLFSNKIAVFIGKISYSLYLWHWVILAYMRYIYGSYELPVNWILFFLIIVIFLSIFSFYFIENPIRKSKYTFRKSFLYFYIIPSLFVFSAYRYVKYSEQNNENTLFGYPKEICHNIYNKFSCKKGDLSQESSVLFIGDSHTGHLNPFIDIIGKKEGWAADVISADSCFFLFNYIPSKKAYNPKQCEEYNQYIYDIYKKYDVIVFGNYWGDSGLNMVENFIDNFNDTLVRLLVEGKSIYIMNSSYNSGVDLARTYFLREKGIYLQYRYSDQIKINEYRLGLKKVESLVAKYNNIKYLDLSLALPNPLVIDDMPVFSDVNHWNVWGGVKMAEMFMQKGDVLIFN